MIEAICGLRAYCQLAYDAAGGLGAVKSPLVALIKLFGKEAPKPKLTSKKINGVSIYVGESKKNYNVVKAYGESLHNVKKRFSAGLGKYLIEELETAIKKAANGKFSVLKYQVGSGRAQQSLVVLDEDKLGLTAGAPSDFKEVLGVKHAEFNQAYNLCTDGVDLAGVGGTLKRAWGAGKRLKKQRALRKKQLAERQERRIKKYHEGLYRDSLERIKFSAKYYMSRGGTDVDAGQMSRQDHQGRQAKEKRGSHTQDRL